jgi:signal transduction histidine kinase
VTIKRRIRSVFSRPVAGIRDVSAFDLLLAAVLTAFVVALVIGATGSKHHGGVAAAIGAVVLTAPVAWRRRAPIAAAATIAVGAGLNAAIFGSMVRCGPSLPAAFIVAFAIGARTSGRRSLLGATLVAANIVFQAFSDPQLAPGAANLLLFLPIAAAFFGIGHLVASRTAVSAQLREQNAELRIQREQTARLAVMADRASVAEDLDSLLRRQISDIAATAAVGRASMSVDPDKTQAALASVATEGRAVLQQMREVVGSLREEAPSEPQPTLGQLADLLHRAAGSDARLTIEGTPTQLPAGVELSGFRIVEQLLVALDDAAAADVEVRVAFSSEALELHLVGPTGARAELAGVVAAVRERAALHGGTVRVDTAGGWLRATARLPLVSGYA